MSGGLLAGFAEGPGCTIAGRTMNGEQLAGAAGALAERINGMDIVAVHAEPSLETVVAVVGGLMAGVTVVPIAPDAGPMERQHILSDSGAKVVLDGESVDIAATGDAEWRAPHAGAPAMVLYTSGTTGLPKGVALTTEAIALDLDLLADAWEWTPEDVLVHGLPLFHVHGLILGLLGALRVGCRLVHTGRPAPGAYAAAAADGGTLFFGVPTVWSRVAADGPACRALRGARLLVSGSAGLPIPTFEAILERCGQGPIERYGMTETLITVSGRADGERRPGWVGEPLPGVRTRLVGDAGEALEPDGETVGELEVKTPTAMSGYLNRPEETAAVLAPDGWVRTGDVAVVASDGWHRIVGRKSTDLIKSGGYRIGAGEVEAALLAHPAVSEAAVVGRPDDDLGEVVVAYVVASGVTEAQLVESVSEQLAAHKRPRRVLLVEALPRNAMGKVQKAQLP